MTHAPLKVFPSLRPGQVEALGPADRGLFRIRTMGSEHLWWTQDDGVLLQRVPDPEREPRTSEGIGTWIRISQVERYPRRGGRAKVWFGDSTERFAVEQWRSISLVSAIAREGVPDW
jgi:hypothetical protein